MIGPQPVCFVVMPFRCRKVENAVGADAPSEIDCDAIWDRIYRPVLVDLGYLPVRADADTGTVIVKDMLERLAFADLVIADVTLPNGNVYYEIGLRHVAVTTGCVLLATSWSRQLFDIDQFRSIRYPLADGKVPQAEADVIKPLLQTMIPRMRNAKTPWHELITAGPEEGRMTAFREQSQATSALQAKMRAIRLAPRDTRAARVRDILAAISGSTLEIPEVAVELLMLVRDEVGWSGVAEFVARLPENTRQLPIVQEQDILAAAEAGDPFEAIGRMEALIASDGTSPEREGIIGGRYKRLWKSANKARVAAGGQTPTSDEERYLDSAIDHYTRGMVLDYNRYYCSNNLPLLLRERNRPGDAERAALLDQFVVAACSRALQRGEQDEWLRSTLLGAAFRARDVLKARELCDEVRREGAAAWKLKATLNDLAVAVEQSAGQAAHADLAALYSELSALSE